jgi:hypothetical protein
MAENKKSFVVYSDWNGTFKALPDEVAGKLIKHILSYVNDENPTTDDYIINALFEQIKATLKRDLKKWEKAIEQRSKAGKASAEARATKSNDRSNSLNGRQRKPTVSDNVNVSVSDNEIKEGKKKSKLFIPPALFELVEYFKENGFPESLAERAFKYYDVAEWKDSKGNQVKNWKQKMQSVWFKDENKSVLKQQTFELWTDPSQVDKTDPDAIKKIPPPENKDPQSAEFYYWRKKWNIDKVWEYQVNSKGYYDKP